MSTWRRLAGFGFALWARIEKSGCVPVDNLNGSTKGDLRRVPRRHHGVNEGIALPPTTSVIARRDNTAFRREYDASARRGRARSRAVRDEVRVADTRVP